MWQSRRRKAEGLIAASLYEALEPAAQAELDRALARWPDLAREAAALRRLAGAIPAEPVAFAGDLMPALRARLHEAPAAARWPLRHHLALAAAALVVAGLFWQVSGGMPAVQAPAVQRAGGDTLAAAIADARAALDRREPGTAVRLVRDALSAHADAAGAGAAQALLAEVEFAHLGRYAEAYAAYAALRTEHPAVFAEDAEAVARYDLLSESKAEAFAPLYALDAARGSFEGLERVLAQHPNQLVAGLAVAAMREIECDPAEAAGGEAAALEAVRARCTHPVAIAQVGLEIGEAYWKRLGNPERARAEFMTVADGGDAGSAAAARDALARLDAGR